MICGSFTLKPDPSSPTASFYTVRGSEELSFHPVSSGCFSGGYYRSKRLPFTDEDFIWHDETSGLLVLLSGAIYNRSEMAGVLGLKDTITDPELIGRLFLLYGPEFIRNLNGDFAVFIMRSHEKEVWLFRDHAGIRPLAYSIQNGTLIFSTDITALCIDLSDGEGIDTNYLTGYFRYIDYRMTPSGKVKKLLPGHFLHFSEKGVRMSKYWQPEKIKTDRTLTYHQMLAELKELLSDAVRIRCDRRFSAGAHVSSGLDSGIVALLAREEYHNQSSFYGFSWSPPDYVSADVKYDERELVRKLCREAAISPVFSDLCRDNFPETVSSFYHNHGFFSEERTLDQAVRAGVNLIFSGWGGDEFVSTAAPSIEADLLRSLKLGLYLRRNEIRHPKKFIRNVVYYVLMPALRIHDSSTAKSFRDDALYLRKPFRKSDKKTVRQFYFHSSRRGHHLGMLNFYHLQDRCENWFIMGYRNGVEYRYPLLDKRIIEFMLRMPSELLCKNDYFRPLLREISEGILPEEIRWNRSKKDPVYWEWMDGLFKDAAVSFMEEVDAWQLNPDLHFVDFDLLKQDIAKYKSQSPEIDSKVLFRALVYIKAIHEFTLAYRK